MRVTWLSTLALVATMAASPARAQEEGVTPWPASPPAPEPGPSLTPPPLLPVEPELPRPPRQPPPRAVPARPAPTPARPRVAHFGHRFGPMALLSLNHVNALWGDSRVPPGFNANVGLRMALLPRDLVESQFNVAVGAFVGVESLDGIATFSPGLRVELLGVRAIPVLIPFLGLSGFVQLLAMGTGQPVFPRAGLALSWNIPASIEHWGSGGRVFSGGGGSSWVIIPLAVIAAVIAFGDLRVYVQPDPRDGTLMGGFSVGVGM